MTTEQAKSELMQIYMSLSEEKKKAIDTLIKASQGTMLICPSCGLEVHSDFDKCPRCGEQLQADCDTCGQPRDYKGICIPYKEGNCNRYSEWMPKQADGEYILKSEAIRVASGYCHPSNIAKELEKLPSVAIPNKVGRWIEGGYDDYKWVCSECGYPRYEYYEKPKAKYCECCGCPMEIER